MGRAKEWLGRLCGDVDITRCFLAVLALLSCAMASAGLASHLAPMPDFPAEALLSAAVAKAALYTALNLLRLLMRRLHYEETVARGKRFDYATGEEQDYTKVVKRRKSLWLDSVKTRELWAQMADDALGGVPAALAFVAFNSRRVAGQELLEGFNDATIIALASLGVLFKALRLGNGLAAVVLRCRERRLSASAGCVNALCCAADGLALACYVILVLRVAGAFPVRQQSAAWLLPVVHVPVIGKQAEYAEAPRENRSGGPAWADPSRRPSELGA